MNGACSKFLFFGGFCYCFFPLTLIKNRAPQEFPKKNSPPQKATSNPPIRGLAQSVSIMSVASSTPRLREKGLGFASFFYSVLVLFPVGLLCFLWY